MSASQACTFPCAGLLEDSGQGGRLRERPAEGGDAGGSLSGLSGFWARQRCERRLRLEGGGQKGI